MEDDRIDEAVQIKSSHGPHQNKGDSEQTFLQDIPSHVTAQSVGQDGHHGDYQKTAL